MIVTYKWIKEFVDTALTPRELADLLTMGGLEVESVEELGASIKNVVVGKIYKIERHPNADRLTVCTVDVGREQLTIVCGAKNMIEGDHVPVALIGAELPSGIKIEKTVLRGVTSHGMMCSTRELGLGEEHAGLLILSKETRIGEDIRAVLGLDDTVFSLGITPNRPDCLSVIGVAREIAALTGVKLKLPQTDAARRKTGKSRSITVQIQNKFLCPCYTGQMISGVKIGPSPEWLKRRLEHVGLRPINNVVDITNYVLYECGQPIHAFDYSLIEGKSVIIRNARAGEKMTTLDGIVRELDPEMLVIADANKAIALAGVMGGSNSEISEKTETVFLESAYFIPETVRRTSKKLGIQTDSSYRFERGVDPNGPLYALHRAADLIREIAGGTVEDCYVEDRGELPPLRKVPVRLSRVNRILGTDIGKNDLKNILNMLQLHLEENGDSYMVTVPSYRVDVQREIDVIEDVARIHGYRNIPVTLPKGPLTVAGVHPRGIAKERMKETCAAFGVHEIITYSFVENGSLKWLDEMRGYGREAVTISNPISDDQNVMRTTLVHSMLSTIAHNKNRGERSVKLYEVGKTYGVERGTIKECEALVIGLMGVEEEKEWFTGEKEVDFFAIKGIAEALMDTLGITHVVWEASDDRLFQPGAQARLMLGGECAGVIGKVHPSVVARYDIKKTVVLAELGIETLVRHLRLKKNFTELPKYPAVIRDIALVVDSDCPAGRIIDLITNVETNLIRSVKVFDIFKGGKLPENKKSVAFRICFRSDERTLTDAEVGELHGKIVKLLRDELRCDIREM